jgi:hypothetical protein
MEIDAESSLGRTTLRWIENPMNLLVAVATVSKNDVKKLQLFKQTTRSQLKLWSSAPRQAY